MTAAPERVEEVAGRVPLEQMTPQIVAYFADDACLIWSDEWRRYWRPAGHGYTSNEDDAGIYTLSDAYAQTRHCDPAKGIVFVRPPAQLLAKEGR